MDERITELEIKLGFTEELVEQLNLTVFRQQQQIEALQAALGRLSQQVQDNQPKEFRSLRDEIPPHY